MQLFKTKKEKLVHNQQKGGVTVSEQVLKDQGLSSDFVLGAIQDGVVMVGKDNIIQLFNPAAAQITGWPANEAVGLDFRSVLKMVNEKGQSFQDADHPFAKALATKSVIKENDRWLVAKNGKNLPISLIVSPILEADSTPTDNVVGVFRDMTQERAEEAQRSDFISTASHEMRTPVAAIEGYLSLVLNPKIAQIDGNARKLLEKASASTKHLGVLFQDLLTSSRVEDGRLQSFPEVVEVGELAQQVADAERFHAQEKNLAVRYVVSSEQQSSGTKAVRPLYYVYADPHRLQEVLQNIINNAIKYTQEGGVTIKLTGDDSVVQLQIQDSGAGIPPEDIPHLFQKFYRVDSSMTRTIGGTGLGLYISRKIVELYNGRLWVESQLGHGSTFFINLPRLTSTQALEVQKKQASSISPLDSR